MTDESMRPMQPGAPNGTPDGGTFAAPGLQPDVAMALQALLTLGAPQGKMLTHRSRAEMKRFVQTAIATPEWLQPVMSATDPDHDGSDSDEQNIPLAFVLLHDESVYETLIDRFADQFEYVALQHNQYLLFGEREQAELRSLFESFLDGLMAQLDAGMNPVSDASSHTVPDLTLASASGADTVSDTDVAIDADAVAAIAFESLRDVVVDHHVRLWQFARSLLETQLGVDSTDSADGAADTVGASGVARTGSAGSALWAPPCHEYDAEFQLALWHVRPPQLQEPILDIGCGANALLVHYLRQAGLDARGLERFGGDREFVLQGDWLSTPLEPGHWGTIISHMGFSNHFFHHHWRKDGHPELYARRFMEIIDALKPGGRFLYAPGLPFFEPLLPEDRVRVVTYSIDVDIGRMLSETGVSADDPRRPALYATEIQRL